MCDVQEHDCEAPRNQPFLPIGQGPFSFTDAGDDAQAAGPVRRAADCSIRPSLDVIIVNWNAGLQLRECLGSLAEARAESFVLNRVTVVDNASSDGSADRLTVPGIPLAVIRHVRNLGFAAACNLGAAASEADYLLFLNPDTRVFPDSIEQATALMERAEHAMTGICGIQLIDQDGRVARSCARLPTPRLFLSYSLGLNRLFPRRCPSHLMADWNHAQSREVDHVIGAFYLVRRRLFQKLNGFDERFFVYLEDVDFSARARAHNYRSWYLADVQAYHKGGGTSDQVKAYRLFHAIHSRILYGYKHFTWSSATVLMLAAMLIEPLVRAGFAVLNGAADQVLDTANAYLLLWRRAPAMLRMSLRR